MSPIRLGPYRIEEPAGSGGSGVVFAALHEAQGVRVAIKLLVGSDRGDDARRALMQEVRATAALDHPRVVRIVDFGELDAALALPGGTVADAGTPWIATEWMAGGSLANGGAPRSWEGLRTLLLGVLAALAHAHARDLVHRDLKPGNVLLGRAGDPDSMKLGDLGIARQYTGEADRDIRGTPAYMAPEQIRGEREGPGTDLYALGVMAWELVTGQAPFTAIEQTVLLHQHLHVPPPPLVPRIPIPPELEAWLRVCLAKLPEDRYATAADAALVLRALGEAQGESPVSLVPLGGRTSTPTFSFDAPDDTTETVPVFPSRPPPGALPLPERWSADDPGEPDLVDTGRVLFGLRPPPLVQRDAERDALWNLLLRVDRAQHAALALLGGPEGCGRTRMAEWIRLQARERGWNGWGVGLRPGDDGVARLVAARFGLDGAPPDRVARVLAERAAGLDPDEVHQVVALLAPLGAAEREELDGQVQRVELAARVIEGAAAARPSVVVLDGVDLDPAAVALARRLASAAVPLLVVATSSAEEGTVGPLAALRADPTVTSIRLQPLGREGEVTLLGHFGVRGAAASHLADRAAGNPAFLIALVAQCLERGWLEVGALDTALAPEALTELPSTLRATASERVASLLERHPDRDPASLELAAVLGATILLEPWEVACAAASVPMERRWLDALLEDRLAVPDPADPLRRWLFQPVAVREILVERAMAAGRAARWHLACAAALADDPVALPRYAVHLAEGGAHDAAVSVLLEACDRARGAYRAQALALLERAMGSMAAARIGPDDPRHSRAWRMRGQLAAAIGDHKTAREAWRRVLESPDAEAHRVERAWARIGMAQDERRNGDADASLALLDRAAAGLDRHVPDHALVWAYLVRNRASLQIDLGRIDQAEAALQADLDDPGALPPPTLVWHRYTLGQAALGRGDLTRATALLSAVRDDALRLRTMRAAADATNLLGDVARKQGRLAEATDHYQEAVRLFGQMGMPDVAIARANLALVRIASGRPDLAERDLLRAEAELRALGWRPMEAAMRLTRAYCAALMGDWASFDAGVAAARPAIDEARFAAADLLDLLDQAAAFAERKGHGKRARMLREWRADLAG